MEEKDRLIETINKAFSDVFEQLNENSRKREEWVKDFHASVKNIQSEYYDIINTMNSEKYLRMW